MRPIGPRYGRSYTNLMWLKDRLSQPFGTDCVEWPFAKQSFGHGVVGLGGRNDGNSLVTHIALESVGKPRPDPPYDKALHSCDNPSCFNPNHLEWNTQKRNVEEMWERGRGYDRDPRSTQGENSPGGKFTEHDIRVMFVIKGLGFFQKEIAQMFDCHEKTVSRILTGKTWGHLGLVM